MVPLLLITILVSISTAILIVHPPEGLGSSVEFVYYEADFCTAAQNVTNVTIIQFDNVPISECNNISFPPNIKGSIVFSHFIDGSDYCPQNIFIDALSKAGAIGHISDSLVSLSASRLGVSKTLSPFCYGLGDNETTELEDWLPYGRVSADVTQPITQLSQYNVLRSMQNQSPKKVWDLTLDPCASTLPVPPSRTPWKGVTCDKYGAISSLSVPFPINGSLPDNFCALESLLSLEIKDDVSFTGLPICQWAQMTANEPIYSTFTISGTSMETIDPRVFQLHLYSLDLSDNKLWGVLNNSNWSTSFGYLSLQGNQFSGPLPNFASFSNLITLNLARNDFSGTIFDFTGMPRLVTLELTDNNFTDLSIPAEQTTNTRLGSLALGFNLLTTFPQALLNSLLKLSSLYLNNNLLISIPDFTASSVITLDISYNKLTGNLVLAPNLVTIIASYNNFSSFGPDSDNLLKLDLTKNNFTGELALPRLTWITFLSMGYNQITNFPVTDRNLVHLVNCDFSNNKISGELPAAVPQTLFSLDLSNNNFSGFVPLSFLNMVVVKLTGNPLSHGSSSLLPSKVVFSFLTTTPFNTLGLECPTYILKDVLQSEFTIDPSYHENKLCRCLPGFYRLPNVTGYCSPCLKNAVCPGREDPLSLQNNVNILAQHGYFPLPNPENPQLMYPCRFGAILPSDPLNPCNPAVQNLAINAYDKYRSTAVSGTRFACADGYTDRLCARCSPGWFRKEGRCLACSGRPEYPLFLIIILFTFLGACTFFAYRSPIDMSTTSINPDGWTFEPKQRVYDFVPLMLHFYQVSTIILVKLQALDIVQTINSLLVTASFSTPHSGIGFECGLPDFQGFVTQYLAVVIFPPVLAFVLGFFFAVRIGIRFYKNIEQNWKITFYQYIYGLFSMYEAIHFPLVTYVLGVFQCTEDPITGISYLTDNPYLTCDSISPAGKVIPLLVYPIGLVGFFVGLGLYLHRVPSDVKESEPIIQSFAFFYIRFKPDRVASGVFFIAINFGLSLVVGLMEPNTDIFPTLVAFILICDFLFVTVFQPYLQQRYNKVRTVNILVSILLFMNNLIYSSSDQFPARSASPAVIYVGLNLGMILFFGYHLYKIVLLTRGDQRLRTLSAPEPHSQHERTKHIEMIGDIKSRKGTSVDPPSTSGEHRRGRTGGSSSALEGVSVHEETGQGHVYVPVPVHSPTASTGFDDSSRNSPLPVVSDSRHSPLPIVSEGGESPPDIANHLSTSGGLVFTENPLADTESFEGSPPSPSGKENSKYSSTPR